MGTVRTRHSQSRTVSLHKGAAAAAQIGAESLLGLVGFSLQLSKAVTDIYRRESYSAILLDSGGGTCPPPAPSKTPANS